MCKQYFCNAKQNNIFLFTSIIILLLMVSDISAAKEVKIAFACRACPYVIAGENAGIEVEIVREALQAVGYRLIPKYCALSKVKQRLTSKNVDGATPLTEKFSSDYYYSDSHITYKNVAIALKERGVQLNSITDLGQYRLMVFQHAKVYLGDAFHATVEGNPNYEEMPHLHRQVAKLFDRQADVIIMDLDVFKHYRNMVAGNRVDVNLPIDIYSIFPPNDYRVGFKSDELRVAFNEGLKKIRSNGIYDQIIAKYRK